MSLQLAPYTIWVLLGVTLLILEMLSGTFVLLFIALGALVAGLIASIGAFSHALGLQALVCAVVSILGVLVLRRPIQNRLLKSMTMNNDIGKEIQIDQDIPPHKTARVSYQGTSWAATNLDSHGLKKGDHVCIVGIDGTTLLVRKVD